MSVELADDQKEPTAGPPPKEAIDYFKRKGLKPGFSFRDVWGAEHNAAFTVAKLMERALLRDVREATQKALEEGLTFRDWKKQALPTLERSGWRKHVSDEALPRRLLVIFETNMRVARATGQEERAQRTKRVMPYMRYELGPSKVHRAEHRAWEGLIFPVDDPFWDKHTPPCDYGCKCRKRQVSKREAEKLGGVSDTPDEEQVKWELPNGRTSTEPAGVHPTFAYPKNGKARAKALEQALKDADEEPAKPKSRASAAPADVRVLFRAFCAWLSREGAAAVAAPAQEAADTARALSDGARRVLAEFVALCPSDGDTTGVHKLPGDGKTNKKYLDGELSARGLVARRESQKRCNLYPTPLARAVCAAIQGRAT